MPWKPIATANRDGRRILVAGGTYVAGNAEVCRQVFPSLVMWDGREWVVCDNHGERAIVRDPRWWMDVLPAPVT